MLVLSVDDKTLVHLKVPTITGEMLITLSFETKPIKKNGKRSTKTRVGIEAPRSVDIKREKIPDTDDLIKAEKIRRRLECEDSPM